MKPFRAAASVLVLLALATGPAVAATYSDATGDFTGGAGFLDMTSVNVNNSGTALTFAINLASDPSVAANNWATHLIGFDTVAGGTGNINGTGGWGKNIQMSTGGMDFFIGNWLNNSSGNPAGATLYSWSGSSWTPVTSTAGANPFNISAAVNTSAVTVSFDFAALGLSAGNSFKFDVYSSDNGADNVLDSLGSSASMTWNSNPFDSAANVSSFAIVAVPEPTAVMLSVLGMAALAICRRTRR